MQELKIHQGDCLESMEWMSDETVQCCVTSPPYFGLRDYGVEGQIGLEETPEQYVMKMVEVFREVRRILKPDGTLWLNLGDSYAGGGGGNYSKSEKQTPHGEHITNVRNKPGWLDAAGMKPKDLMGMPWRVAFALQADGWYLRQDIIWHKPNPMPESVTDRCTKAHEYIFLLSKGPRYFFNSDAMKEPATGGAPGNKKPIKGAGVGDPTFRTREGSHKYAEKARAALAAGEEMVRNRRSVWTVATRPYKGAHFATYPPALIEPCILAGSRTGDIVFDPFGGSGTTAEVAIRNKRSAVLCELNPDYVPLIKQRTAAAILDWNDI